ncbi:cytochrome c [Rhizobacter sp. Root1221]|uniref:c-type cytochrome n=1 Tax=Rhizobacter sp. Root1221 TaxID=1736433 RepID=UPI0009EA47B3|nr:cytochrome c [Rhizobacter sp. Root1221]
MRHVGRVLAALGLLAVAALVVLDFRSNEAIPADAVPTDGTAEQVKRGLYLATVGNCLGCHTAPGGVPYAGGRAIDTPFGAIYTSNLTPDDTTGIGTWSSAHLWRALHHGRSKDGRRLFPAFPYPNYTHVTREDSDAIYAYLRSLPPVRQPNAAHTVGFPYDTQVALAVWRALFFSPGGDVANPSQSAEWNRGAYLVQGLGHCNACHSARNLLGGSSGVLDLSGGLIPMQNWYAPSLTSPDEAGVATWDTRDVVALLRDGVSTHASVLGPMAEVVQSSTQHLNAADLQAMAVYLKALPQQAAREIDPAASQPPRGETLGSRLYGQHCAQCHGDKGEGVPGAYPALAGNRAVTMDPPANLVRVVLLGGFAPSTAGNPRPFGMPPFATTLSEEDVAAVLTHLRKSWGNQGSVVSALEVHRYRTQD